MRTSVIILIGIVMIVFACTATRAVDEPVQQPLTPQQEKAQMAWETYESMASALSPGGIGGSVIREQMYVWSLRTAHAETELAKDKATRTSAYQRHLERMRELRNDMQQAYRLKGVAKGEYTATQFYFIEATLLVKQN